MKEGWNDYNMIANNIINGRVFGLHVYKDNKISIAINNKAFGYYECYVDGILNLDISGYFINGVKIFNH